MAELEQLKAKAQSLANFSCRSRYQIPSTNPQIQFELEDEIKSTKMRCEKLWNELAKAHHRVEKTQAHSVDPSQIQISILRATKEKYLKEIKLLKDKENSMDITIEEKSPIMLQVSLEKQIQKQIQEMQELIEFLRDEIKQTTKEITLQQQTKEEQQIILNETTQRVAQIDSNQLEGTQNSRVIAKGNRELMEKLLNFLESYYPEKEESEVSLKALLEELMNISFNGNGDYLDIEQFNKTDVELLIRAGIAINHPNDNTKLKLMEFHL